MAIFLDILWYYLWVAPHVLLGIILFVMVRRRLHRSFPMFFLYTASEILQFGVLFAISRSHVQFGEGYVRLFSGGLAVSSALRFGVIYEVFGQIFADYPALTETGKMLFRGVTIFLLLAGVGVAVFMPGKNVNLLMLATNTLDRTVSLLQCGLLLSVFIFSRYFALSLRSHAFGIALGLGTYASVQMATSAVLLYVGSTSNRLPNFLTMGAYHCCVLIWMFYLVRPEWAKPHASNPPPEHNLDIWNQELQRLLQR
ncbi:MAG TPA: hypothetical protein VN948_04380 [Terriglobales bacterium]|nr:hypothetical protein [Terriglobales bacterium]